MREPIEKFYAMDDFLLTFKNNNFVGYIQRIIQDYYNTHPNSDIDDDFVLPGRITINFDGHEAILDISGDLLLTLKQVISIGTFNVCNRYKENEYVDLRDYRNMCD